MSKAIEPRLQTGLVALMEGKRFLAHARDTLQVLDLRNKAAAVEHYLKQRDDSTSAAIDAAELRLRAERRLGELLAETVDHAGGRPKKNADTVSVFSGTIPDSISQKQSSRYQQAAKVPESEFETLVVTAREKGDIARLTSAAVMRLAKEIQRQEQRDANRVMVEEAPGPVEHVQGKTYPTIVIDPPWDWGDEGDVSQFGRGDPTYATMSIEELLDLPVGQLASENAHIYLWITNRSLPKGFSLLDRWGFRYVTCLTWCKPSIGMGNYFRGSTEQILFGVRGSLPLLRADVGTWFQADRQGKHSTKPEEFYRLVESCSPGPWLEMFARQPRQGWSAWGAEA